MSCAAALALGVLFGVKVRFQSFRAAIFPLLAFLIFAVLCTCFTLGGNANGNRGKRFKTGLARFIVVCVSFGIGFVDFGLYAARYRKTVGTQGEEVYVSARVEEWRTLEKGVWAVLGDLSFDGAPAAGKLTLFLYSATAEKVTAKSAEETPDEGSIVAFNAEIAANTAWQQNDENRAYEWRRNIRYEAKSCKNFRVLGNAAGLFARIRVRLKTALERSASQDAYALSYAILTGETAEINGELLENFRYGGVAHIFAVSGLHVGALFAFAAAIFSKKRLAGLPSAAKWLIVAAIVLFYGAICGFSASVARAIVMCLAFYADKLSGFKRDSLESMGKAAVIVLLVSPVSLFEAGFLLSFSAVAGILCLTPTFSRLLSAWLPDRAAPAKSKLQKPLKSLISLISVSLGATAATVPVMCRCFGYASGASLILNVLVVPLVSAAFPILLALAALAALLPPLAAAILYLPSLFLSLLGLLFYAVDFSPFAIAMSLSAFPIVAYYAACVFASERVNLRYGIRAAGVSLGGIAFLTSFFL